MFYSRKLKKFKDINHCFFSRNGGYSKGLFKSLNCGFGSSDNKKNIIKNLSYVAKKMGIKNKNLILMNQTHSNKVKEIYECNKKKINSDALITNVNGLALAVLTADCVPVLIFDHKNKVIACIHAGWRGAFSGIIKNTVNKIKKLNSKNEIYATIGPCIGKKNYEVDLRFYRKFMSQSKKNQKFFSYKNRKKKLFDLRKFVADKLLKLKVKVDHVNHDTFKESNNFFSYRKSSNLGHKDYGRCISIISLN